LLGQAKVQVTITDPPYNVKIDGHVCGLGRTRHQNFLMASGEMGSGEFIEFLEVVSSLMVRHSANGAITFVFMDWAHSFEMLTAGRRVFTQLKNICVWCKTQPGMGTFYRSQHELCFVWKCGRAPHINNFELGQHGRLRTNVWSYSAADLAGPTRAEGLKLHPTIKPVALFQDAMLDCSHRGGLVLDPFCGSGTVLIAAERARRKARAMELEPAFVDLTIRRWQSYTGEKAVHCESGLSFGQTEGRAKRSGRR
jgi:DNA modification methylase